MMKINALMLSVLILFAVSTAVAATDGFYTISPTAASWYGTDENRLKTPGPDYVSTYGDEASVTYLLPWPFIFYGQTFNQITADTNGNIWFGVSVSANSFTLGNNGLGPVIAAWNNDLSSYLSGGVFIQHKSNPECVVVEWKTETYTNEGRRRPNTFETVLFPSGQMRLDYQSFTPASTNKDLGSGISLNDGTYLVNLTSSAGNMFTLGGQSFLISTAGGSTRALDVSFTGGGGTVTSNVGVTWNASNPANLPAGAHIVVQLTPTLGYIFNGWSGPCSGSGTCSFVLNQNTNVTASFSVDISLPLVLSSSGVKNRFIQAAYDGTTADSNLKLVATNFYENFSVNQNKTVTIKGGYNINFTNNSAGQSGVNGVVTVTNGTLVVDGLTIR